MPFIKLLPPNSPPERVVDDVLLVELDCFTLSLRFVFVEFVVLFFGVVLNFFVPELNPPRLASATSGATTATDVKSNATAKNAVINLRMCFLLMKKKRFFLVFYDRVAGWFQKSLGVVTIIIDIFICFLKLVILGVDVCILNPIFVI